VAPYHISCSEAKRSEVEEKTKGRRGTHDGLPEGIITGPESPTGGVELITKDEIILLINRETIKSLDIRRSIRINQIPQSRNKRHLTGAIGPTEVKTTKRTGRSVHVVADDRVACKEG